MPAATRYRFWVWQNKGATLLGRVRNLSGSYITQAGLTTITRNVYDLDNSAEVVISGTLTIASVVFDSLQATAADLVIWSRDGAQIDSTGWNFKDAIPATAFPKGEFKGRQYRRYAVEYVFDPTSGEDFVLPVECLARNLYSTAN